MFNFLKGNQITLKITLDHPEADYFPGENLQAMISVESNKELKIQEGRVALICREEYEYFTLERTTNSDGRTNTEINTRWFGRDHEVAKELFLLEGTLSPNRTQTFPFSTRVPADALPSIPGKIIKVTWLVKVTLARKLATDINAETQFTVFSAFTGEQQPGRYGQSNELGEIDLSLELPGTNWLAEDEISGKLQMLPRKKFDATEVRLELVEVENVSYDQGHRHENSLKVKLTGKMHFDPGQPVSLPFEVQVPRLCSPSASTNAWSVTWKLRVILARFMRKDTVVEQELKIYTGRRT